MFKSRARRRKRPRADSVTPRRSNRTTDGRFRATRTPEKLRAEPKIVWRDSPVDKQMKASGTDKIAIRRELQDFVERLACKSEHMSPCSSDVDKECGRQRAGVWTEETAVSRPFEGHVPMGKDALGSSHGPTPPHSCAGRQRTTEERKSQDELLRILDQMEQKYASPEVAGAVPGPSAAFLGTKQSLFPMQRPLTPPEVTGGGSTEEIYLTATAGSSYSLAAAQSLQTVETPKVDERQDRDRIRDASETLMASEPPNPRGGCGHGGKQEAVNVSAKSTVVEADFFDDLTDESWALLDQLQSQRVPVKGTSQSKTESVGAQDTASNVQPVPPAAHSGTTRSQSILPSNASAIAVRSMHDTEAAQAFQSLESYKRFMVLEVDRNVADRSLLLRLLDDQDVQLEALLSDDWYDVVVDAGDTVNIVLTEQDGNAFFSQAGHESRVNRQLLRIQVDNAHNVVVVHPDILVQSAVYQLARVLCLRCVSNEGDDKFWMLATSCPTGDVCCEACDKPEGFLGTLKHDLFEHALLHDLSSAEELAREAIQIVRSNILGLVECGLNEELALLELQKVIGEYQKWVNEAIAGAGTPLNLTPPNSRLKARVSRVLATEEMMWSIKWGLKGATDASVEGTIVGQGHAKDECAETRVLPLELKTGSKRYEHQGQVILYTLLLNERYRQQSQEALLIYVPSIETNRITAVTAHVRGLIMARNSFASAIAKTKAVGSSTSGQILPPMIRNRRDCERCFQVDECVLVHAATENGTEESSGLEELFTLKTNHLVDADLLYFRQWNRLIMLEQQHAEKHLRALWLQVGLRREQAQESSTCLAHLKLVSDTPSQSGSGTKRTLRFVRDRRKRKDVESESGGSAADWQPTSFAGVRFRADERVILSAESLDGKSLLVHVSRASVRKIEHGLITIETRQCIPSIVMSGLSTVGKEYTWRLDKDAIMSGLQRAKENLVRLFIGPPPEVISAGTARRNRPELQIRTTPTLPAGHCVVDAPPGIGDVRRRNLIVHLTRPQFTARRLTDLVTQRCQDLANRDGKAVTLSQTLLGAFRELNVDQQRAVQRVVSGLDYALILGMPGTGKTATIAFTVRVLLYLGFSVLVTSYTHSAVDNLLLKLLACNVPMLRIGNAAQVHPRIAEFTLDRQVEREQISRVQTMEAKLVNAQLVGCTCLSVNSHVLFKKRRFDFCIVDEATQITQPIVLSALGCADTFVLVGDHYQLPPLVANAQARKEGMDVSLFRRLAEAHPEATQQLSYQYRMNRDIMLLANRLVYGGKLKCGSVEVASNHLDVRWQCQEPDTHKLPWPMQVLSKKQGVVFMDTDTMASATTESAKVAQMGTNSRHRMENVAEAQLIAGLVELLVLGSVPAEEIAVISPFRSQIALIQQHLTTIAAHRRAGGSDWVRSIEVSTIDKYQGKDKDVILVSFVRCNEENHVGELLTDWRRINVALTRAKQKLLLVGSGSTLSGGSAFLYELLCVVQEQRWGYELPADAIESLRRFAVSAAAPTEPDPEQGATRKLRARQPTGDVKVSILQRSARSSNGDIESLVPDVSILPLRPQPRARLPHLMPLSRDVFGEL